MHQDIFNGFSLKFGEPDFNSIIVDGGFCYLEVRRLRCLGAQDGQGGKEKQQREDAGKGVSHR